MTETRPLEWLREVDQELRLLNEMPQFPLPAPFDWKKLEIELQRQLGRSDLKIAPTHQGWVTTGQLKLDFKESASTALWMLSIEWAPLQTRALFMTHSTNLKDLMAELFASEEAMRFFYEPPLVEGFYFYLATEALNAIKHQAFADPLTPRVDRLLKGQEMALHEESYWVIDLSLCLSEKRLWGKVLLSETFSRQWRSYFATLPPPPPAKDLPIDCGLEVGRTILTLDEWKQLKAGDFVVLENCLYDPSEREGSVLLTLNQKAFLRARLKGKDLKISGYSIYEELKGELMGREPFEDDDEDENEFDEDEEDEDEEEEDDLEDEDEEDEEIFDSRSARRNAPLVKAEKNQTASSKSPAMERSLNDLPLQLIVEVGRLQMTVGNFSKLSPGNLLELNVAPEQGVDLVINGKKVGRGELMRMGDVLGVRILSL